MLRLDYFLKFGGLLIAGDELHHVNAKTFNVKSGSVNCFNTMGILAEEYFITNFVARSNAVLKSMKGDLPVIVNAGYAGGKEENVYLEAKKVIIEGIRSWVPDMVALIKLSEIDKLLVKAENLYTQDMENEKASPEVGMIVNIRSTGGSLYENSKVIFIGNKMFVFEYEGNEYSGSFTKFDFLVSTNQRIALAESEERNRVKEVISSLIFDNFSVEKELCLDIIDFLQSTLDIKEKSE